MLPHYSKLYQTVVYITSVKVYFPVSCDFWNTLYGDSYSSVSLDDLHNLKLPDVSSTGALKKVKKGKKEKTWNGIER